MVRTPQQNARVERKHRHILNVGRALRFQGGLPIDFWGECVLTAAYLINRTPTRILEGKTPFELLFGRKADLSLLRVFGCLAYAKVLNPSDKFASRSRRCIFVGYPFGKKGWNLFDLETGEYFQSRDVSFIETDFPLSENSVPVSYSEFRDSDNAMVHSDPEPRVDGPEPRIEASTPPVDSATLNSDPSSSTSEHEIDANGSHVEGEVALDAVLGTEELHEERAVELGRGKRAKIPNKNHKDFVSWDHINTTEPSESSSSIPFSGSLYPLTHYVNYNTFSSAHRHFLAALNHDVEPTSFTVAMRDPRWQAAMAEEIAALESNETWSVCDLPQGKSVIGCMWVYKIKRHADGSIERFKARLVVLGNHQETGIDYTETFAPTVKMVTVRTFLAVASIKKWELHQMDVRNAFLHSDLSEDVYMRMPPGFSRGVKGKVCRLRKSLYGLKQAPRCWYAKLHAALCSYGFIMSASDNSLFTFRKNGVALHILVYVDDLVIAGNDSSAISNFKSYLSTCFFMKDLGKLKYFLGLEVAHSSRGLFVCQGKYTLDLLSETGLLGCKPASIPMDEKHQLALATDPPLEDGVRYRRLVGKLIYLTLTRPEICYSVHILSQFMQKPTQSHLEAALRVLRYLKGSPGQGILFRRDSVLSIEAYCDAAYASCPITRRSITAYFVCIGGTPISWKTKKQDTVSLSSTEAEYRAMVAATCEVLWLKGLFSGLGIEVQFPVRLHCDNQSAMHIANNPVYHERTKHIEIDCHFIRDHIRNGFILPCYVHTTSQLADILTKALGRPRFLDLLGKLGLSNIHAPT
ncbi:hypothetical protein vseg_000891 [Gypsophila vaccaria]